MIRSIVWLALLACSVARHRWPVSAKAIACSIVSASRISPTRITSGAWRSVFFSAWCHECVSMPTSRCVTSESCDGCTYSTGSSTVMMWPGEVRLRWSIIAASVVDLPEPVAPTTRTRPRLVITTSLSTGGSFSFSKLGISEAIVRITMPTLRCCTKTLTRKRETPGIEIAKLHSISLANSARCVSFISEWASIRVTSAASFCAVSGFIAPCDFMLGGKSAETNRSEPPAWLMVASSLCM